MTAESPAIRTNKWRRYALIVLALSGVGLLILLFIRRRYRPVEELARGATLSQPMTRLMLIVNKTPPAFDAAEVRARVEQTYDCTVGAVLMHSEEMMNLASSGIFALHYPDHPMTEQYRDIARQLIDS